MQDTILVIGSSGQIGTELVEKLRQLYGENNVIASDIIAPANNSGLFEELNVMDGARLFEIIKKNKINQVYLLAALLSATAEKKPEFAWKLNMEGLFNVLNLAKEKYIAKVYWPSSIAVFGSSSRAENTPQYCVMEPGTVYGISKLAGERWCEYYHSHYQVDVRSLRYPGLISYKSPPGGGTTDYAVHIFHEALKNKQYECFLSENTVLPMMYMPDAIDATIKIMQAPADSVKIRSSYNVTAMSFSPARLAKEIQKYVPDFSISYNSDYRQKIADGWPKSIDDSLAGNHWGWKPSYNLTSMTLDMIENLKNNY